MLLRDPPVPLQPESKINPPGWQHRVAQPAPPCSCNPTHGLCPSVRIDSLSFSRRITLTITAPSHVDADLLSLEIPADTTISTLKESIQAESQILKTSQHLYHNGRLLSDDTKTMEQLQIGDGEMLALHVRDTVRTARPGQQAQPSRQQAASQARGAAGYPDPETIRLQLLGNPELRQQAISQRPELAGVIESPERFAQALQQMQDHERDEQNRRRQQIADLNADPFDIDAQMRIAEMIREERVQENLQNAIEHNPEGEEPRGVSGTQRLIANSVWSSSYAIY